MAQHDSAEVKAYAARIAKRARRRGPVRRPVVARWVMRARVRLALTRAAQHSPVVRWRIVLVLMVVVLLLLATAATALFRRHRLPEENVPSHLPLRSPTVSPAPLQSPSPWSSPSSEPSTTPGERRSSPAANDGNTPSASVGTTPATEPVGVYIAVRLRADNGGGECGWNVGGVADARFALRAGEQLILVAHAASAAEFHVSPVVSGCGHEEWRELAAVDVGRLGDRKPLLRNVAELVRCRSAARPLLGLEQTVSGLLGGGDAADGCE